MRHQKTVFSKFHVLSMIIVCAVAQPEISYSQGAKVQIQTEIDRLRELVTLNFSEGEDAEKRARKFREQLASIEKDLKAGYFYWALKQLQGLDESLFGLIAMSAEASASESENGAFAQEWRNAGKELDAKREEFVSPADMPAAVQALAEASLNQSQPYYESSRLLAMNTSPAAGRYYIAQAMAHVEFALFCQGLSFSEERPASTMQSLVKELQELETRVVSGYEKADFGKEEKKIRYNRFVGANTTIKMVRELEQSDMRYGALYKFLEAVMHFELIDKPLPTADLRVSLNARSQEQKQQLSANELDNSIAWLFWEIARSELDDVNPDSPSGESLKKAAVILETVVPKYFQLVGLND